MVYFVIKVDDEFIFSEYLKFLLSILLGGYFSISSGFILGVVADNENIAAVISTPYIIPGLLLSGGFKTTCNMNAVLKPLSYISP